MVKFLLILSVLLIGSNLAGCAHNDAINQEITDSTTKDENQMEDKIMKITVGETVFTVKLENNSSAKSLVEHLQQGEVRLEMNDYANMEKVGELPFSLPQNNRHLQTVPGDIILYLGRYFVIYYGNNDYSLTKLGVIEGDYTGSELKEILGKGDVTIKISL